MAADGTPDFAARQCGEEIARLRTARGWSRSKLVAQLLETLDTDDPNYDSIGESWLARLENGRMVKIPRQMLDAICRALACTEREQARVLLYADRSVVTTPEEQPNAAAEVLNYLTMRLHREARSLLDTLIGQRRACDLSDEEMLELHKAALHLVCRNDQ
ncbi:MAG TPA: helix-turn-helix transcriptional regulator [Roseiflexaceae bacterium]|nr:helix-turn-helix transcriptional regulator [Roseiflexaceae bacterium]